MSKKLGEDCLTADEVSGHFRVTVKTVNRWRKQKILVGYWTGRRYVYEPKGVEALKGKLRKLKKGGGAKSDLSKVQNQDRSYRDKEIRENHPAAENL